MSSFRFVVDTSTLFSALINPQSVPRRAFNKAVSKGQLILSEPVFEEILDVFHRPKIRRYVKPDEISRFVALLLNISSFYSVNEDIKVCKDVKDNKFLELAVAGNATFLISSDEDLKVLNPFRAISILSPSDFLVLNMEK